jgi:hypothetical protein
MELKRKFELELIDREDVENSFELVEIISLQDNELRGVFECKLDDFSMYYEDDLDSTDLIGAVTIRVLATVELDKNNVKNNQLASYNIRNINIDTPETEEYIADTLEMYYAYGEINSVVFDVVLTEKDFCI